LRGCTFSFGIPCQWKATGPSKVEGVATQWKYAISGNVAVTSHYHMLLFMVTGPARGCCYGSYHFLFVVSFINFLSGVFLFPPVCRDSLLKFG